MNKKIKLSSIIILLFFWFISLTYWYVFNSNFTEQISNKNTNNSFKVAPVTVSNTSNLYIGENKRFYFSWNDIFKSETYWNFSTTSTWYLVKSNTTTNCEGKLELYFTWTSLINSEWWKWFNFWNWSYFCPDSWEFKINLISSTTPKFFDDFTLTNTLSHTDIDWEVDTRAIFDSSNIVINWVVNKEVTIHNEFNWWTDTQQLNNQLNTISSNLSGSIWEYWFIKEIIDRNIIKYTKWLEHETLSSTLTNIDDKSVYLYDYSWNSVYTPTNQNNKWKILNLWSLTSRIKVNWEKTIILKWWNLYIKNDIYNDNENSILTIVVKRNPNNKKNWWNIYIDPNVTNIDAVIIAEWSILNFDWTKVLSKWDISWTTLKKQLMIYGSVFTRNTIWVSKAPYDSDHYFENNLTTELYDLSKLRFFQVTTNDHITTGEFRKLSDTKIISIDNDWKPIKYSFAWKREKFADDNTNFALRWTNKYAGLVIEYNPNIKNINPKFFQK